MTNQNRIALAYSGGLDTSVAVPWLIEHYDAEVVCVVVDVGQGLQDLQGIEARAAAAGAIECHVVDVREVFLEEFIWSTLRASAVYGRKYLPGRAMARPLIAREVVRVAREVNATGLSHGCTGKGNDQVEPEWWDIQSALERRSSLGGSTTEAVRRQLESARTALDAG